MTAPAHPSGRPLSAEQTFFADPAIDRVLDMLMTVAAELHVTRDRLACLEALLVSSGTLPEGALDGFTPAPDLSARLDASRRAFVAQIMRASTGEEVSLGAPADLAR